MKNYFSCFVIGDDHLVIKCCYKLLESNHTILGVISNHPQVKAWTIQHKIRLFTRIKEAEKTISDTPIQYDYLFSISNSKILSKKFLETPTRLAINYHNGPLPQYAGVHATHWAILNKEKEHTVNWHIMETKIDSGKILCQKTFNIEPNETALTLNFKCHRMAASLFDRLIQDLANEQLKPTPQIGTARYYTLKDKAPNNGLILWNESAENIDALFRATNAFGFTHRFSTPKILVDQQIIYPKQLELTQTKSTTYKPGSIVKNTDKGIQVATQTYDILINQAITHTGENVDLQEQIKEKLFNQLSEDKAKTLETFNNQIAPKELFWVNQFKNIAFFQIPYIAKQQYEKKRTLASIYELDPTILTPLATSFETNPEMILLSILLYYFYRINQYQRFTVGFTYDDLLDALHKDKTLESFFANEIPLTIGFNVETQDFESFVKKIKALIQKLKYYQTYEQDIFLRHQEINHKLSDFPLSLNVTKSPKLSNSKPGHLTLYFNPETSSLTFSVKNFEISMEKFQLGCNIIFSHLETLLYSIVKTPKKPLVTQPFLTKSEIDKLLSSNKQQYSNKTIPPKMKFVHQYFEEQARLGPTNIALRRGNAMMPYLTLNSTANRLANYLIGKGVKKGDHIGTCLQPSFDLAITMLAIFKAGGVYIPLDPNYPLNQLEIMTEDANISYLITKTYLANEKFKQFPRIIRLDQENEHILCKSAKNPNVKLTHEDLAYIVYTSGSTGKPKGVKLSHKNIHLSMIARQNAYKHLYKTPQELSVLLLLSISFDTSIGVMLWPLISGGILVLPKPSQINHPEKLAKAIATCKITTIIAVPSLYSKILDHPTNAETNTNNFESLKLVIFGGDRPEEDLPKRHKKWVSQAPLINEFGLTETSIQNSSCCIYDPKTKVINPVSIGEPIDSTSQFFILDIYKQPVPYGIPGELYIGGECVAQGYVNHAKQNQERFIENHTFIPDYTIPKIYKTGDIAYHSKDGFVLVGRIDHQVKLRGYRIELPQIEEQITKWPNIRQCVAAIQKDTHKNDYLVVYIVPKNKEKPLHEYQLRNYLIKNLPHYMIPNIFMLVDELPLTKNKKIDRKQLPVPEFKKRSLATPYVEPKDDTERYIANLWTSLLEIQDISICDSFFELGGHSLLVTEMLLRIEKFFKIELHMSAFFENPTIEHLANLITGKTQSNSLQTKQAPFIADSKITLPCKTLDIMVSTKQKNNTILLTGATGFLGIYLLQELILNTDLTVYCLIRANTDEGATIKLNNVLNNHKLVTKELTIDNPRIKVIKGDLSKNNLGLTQSKFEELAKNIDLILHNGAHVHHISSYSYLKPTNVDGTLTLIELANTKKTKPIHYVSTLGAIPTTSKNNIPETFIIDNTDADKLKGGYPQTKWTAERLLARWNIEQGGPVTIYRPSWILNHSKTGDAPSNNHLLKVLQACVEMKAAPKWLSKLDIIPVDFISKFIVSSIQKNVSNITFNVHNPKLIAWIDLIDLIQKELAPKLKLVKIPDWNEKYLKKVNKSSAMFPLLSIYLGKSNDVQLPEFEKPIDDENTQKYLGFLTMEQPPVITSEILKIFFKTLFSEPTHSLQEHKEFSLGAG